jgi:hypothetical protein
MTRVPTDFIDICLIYRSQDEPGKWVAHSLNTDQIAVGRCVLEAFVELKPVVRAYIESAETDRTILFPNLAPKKIRDKLATAKSLPSSLLARAEELVTRYRKVERKPRNPVYAPMTVEASGT